MRNPGSTERPSTVGQMKVAVGIGCDGRKTVPGFREGATENAAVVNALLRDLLERGHTAHRAWERDSQFIILRAQVNDRSACSCRSLACPTEGYQVAHG